jgi:hypothetical protein
MSDETAKDAEEAVADLADWVRQKKKPTRHHARSVLIALGRLPDLPGNGTSWRERIKAAVHPLEEAWEAAVQDELMLACTEHVTSVDPRYLDHPRYDFEYAIRARERLEARLLSAEVLGHAVEGSLLAKVERADAQLEPYLRDRPR